MRVAGGGYGSFFNASGQTRESASSVVARKPMFFDALQRKFKALMSQLLDRRVEVGDLVQHLLQELRRRMRLLCNLRYDLRVVRRRIADRRSDEADEFAVGALPKLEICLNL